MLAENRFPAIWMPSREQRDLQILLRHRDQFVRIRTRVQLSLQALALSHGLRRGHSLWTRVGQHTLRALGREFENVIMVVNDRRHVWWATPERGSETDRAIGLEQKSERDSWAKCSLQK